MWYTGKIVLLVRLSALLVIEEDRAQDEIGLSEIGCSESEICFSVGRVGYSVSGFGCSVR